MFFLITEFRTKIQRNSLSCCVAPYWNLFQPKSSIFCLYFESESEHFVKNLQNVLDVPSSIF